MRALVTGGRHYNNRPVIYQALDALAPSELGHGDASGADRIAACWARETGTPCQAFPAFWRREGRAAGPRRNTRMLREFKPDVLLAFPGHNGTTDMVVQARQAKVPVTPCAALRVYTARINYSGADRIDITRRANHCMAPSGMLLSKTLHAVATGERRAQVFAWYEPAYLDEMRDGWRLGTVRAFIESLRDEVTLVCFCPDAATCHRRLAAEIITKVHGESLYLGEREYSAQLALMSHPPAR